MLITLISMYKNAKSVGRLPAKRQSGKAYTAKWGYAQKKTIVCALKCKFLLSIVVNLCYFECSKNLKKFVNFKKIWKFQKKCV